MKKEKAKNGTMKKVLSIVKPYRALIALSILCALFSVAGELLIPVFTGDAIDFMLGPGKVDFAVVGKKALLIAAAAAAAAAQYLMAVFNNKAAYNICQGLRNRLSNKLHTLPVSFLDSHSSGDILSRMTADIDSFSDGLLMGFTQLFTGVITIAAILGIMFSINWVIALAVVVLTPFSILIARFIASRTHRYFTEQAEIRGDETALVNELIEGQAVLKAFAAEEKSLREFDDINEKLRSSSLKATFFSSLVNPSTRLINNIVYAIVALIGAFFAISAGSASITVGTLSVFLSYAGQYAKPFNEISSVVTEFQNALTCAQRIFDILEEDDQTAESENPLSPPADGNVSFQNVCFSYSRDRKLIENFNLDVKAGQRVAIVGPTGCGKTTLINLIMRFYDVDSGSISVDSCDIRDMTRHDLRSRYGMVLQDTWLSGATVRENIAYGKPDATDEEVIAAAKAAHAHSFIKRLPKGYDTPVIASGANLSAGQRQLLCIARAMLVLPPMLILDEATSSIDTRTEMKVQSAFALMMKGRTSFIVAHRLSTIREADIILVMKNGKIIEQGKHNELLEKNGFYAELYNSQFAK